MMTHVQTWLFRGSFGYAFIEPFRKWFDKSAFTIQSELIL